MIASTKNQIVDKIIQDETNDDSFFVVDMEDIVNKVKYWQLKLPRIKLFYAVKCNPLPEILQAMAHFELGIDSASKKEIDLALKAGVPPSKIIFANPSKHRGSIRHAKECGVSRMTFDNTAELDKIAKIFPKAELVIRLKVDDTGAEHPLGEKFGIEPKHIPAILDHAAHLKLNLIGVSFHVGSGCKDVQRYEDALLACRSVFDAAVKYGYRLTLLDVGGGFPGSTGFETFFDACAATINKSLDIHFPAKDFPNLEVIGEPGRYVVASAFTLYASVIGKKTEKDRMVYYFNDGIHGNFGFKISCDRELDFIPVGKKTDAKTHKSTVWGPTMDPTDIIEKNIQLPELAVGDWVMFKDMGAYTNSVSRDYSNMQVPAFHFVMNSAVREEFEKTAIGKQLIQEIKKTQSVVEQKLDKVNSKNRQTILVKAK